MLNISSSPIADACDLVAAYRSGRADPVDVTEQCLVRATQLPNTFITITASRARTEAQASRARWQQGCPLSEFDGVPIAWKDLFDVQGTPTTAGAELYRHAAPAKRDAPLVATARRAGLVTIGKTNLSEFAYSGLGLNPHFGTPVNPTVKGDARAPGGSSCGSAIAVVGGAAIVAMGTDTAGSIRIPSAFNGIVGYRASSGRYSIQAVRELSRTLDTLGPLANSVRDVVALDAIFQGHSEDDPVAALSATRLHFVLDEDILTTPLVQDAVRHNVLSAADRLAKAGARIERRRCEAFHSVLDLVDSSCWLGAVEAFAFYEPILNSEQADRLDRRVRKRLEASRQVGAGMVIRLYQAREELMKMVASELDGALLLTPTVAHVAPPLAPLENDDDLFARVNLATLRLTMPGSFMNMPCLAIPTGTDECGLSTSMLIAAACGQDELLLRAGLTIETVSR
jgi:aspartyl-tRNA(Asn)/glutamyl-tRNA(Gln) amidotransferase subunit A